MVEVKEIEKDKEIANERVIEQLLSEYPFAFRKVKGEHDGEIMFQAGIKDPDEFQKLLSDGANYSVDMREHLSKYSELHDEVILDLEDTRDQKVYNSVIRLISYYSMKNGGPCFSRKGIILPFETADVYIPPYIISNSLDEFPQGARKAFLSALSFVNTYNMLLDRDKHIKRN